MVNISQEYLTAATNSLLQTIAELASKAANLSGALAEANVTIAEQRAKLAELEKPSTLKAVP